MMNRVVLGICVALAGCVHQRLASPQGPPKFTVGDGYEVNGAWRYPQVFNNYDATGLATVMGDDQAPITADNEAYDPAALAAASPLLQLPAIVRVTNLVNGYSMDVRVNDRGPADPGRVLAVTPKVARLLGFPDGGLVEVEVKLDSQRTAALDATLGQGPQMTAAPVAGITAQSLAAPGTSGAGAVQNLTPQTDTGPVADTGALSGQVSVTTPAPGPLYVQVPGFGRERDARRIMNENLYGLTAMVVPVFGGDRTFYAIRLGPFHDVASADAALAQVNGRNVAGAEIIVR
jgi:rare lipoprotein A